MSKGNIFPGQPVIGQVLSLLRREMVDRVARDHKSDRYYKKFTTYAHLVTMLYGAMSGATNIRGVVLGLLSSSKRLKHLGIKHFPRRSTISDANRDRSSEIFGEVYARLYKEYSPLLPDSRSRDEVSGRLKIMDSTTISLFSDILKGVGRIPVTGKRKGGIKAHTVIDSGEDVPQFVCYSQAAKHDGPFLKQVKLVEGDIVVFDRAYVDYDEFSQLTAQGIYFVTRQKENAQYEVIKTFPISKESDKRIISDQQIKIKAPKTGKEVVIRRITFFDPETKSELVFWTNIFWLNADKIAEIYKRRWQIELLYKRLKQNFPLKYFLGDSQNAIEIQIWCCLIAHLLYKVILKQSKRKWAFSNFCDLIRQHLFTYTDLAAFLNDPEKILREKVEKELREAAAKTQMELFPP